MHMYKYMPTVRQMIRKMYRLLVYTTLLQLFISFDVTNANGNSEILELPENKYKDVNVYDNGNVNIYNVSEILYSQAWRIIFNINLPMNSSGGYVLKMPLKQSNKTLMALNTCECWEGRNSRILKKNTPLPKLKEDEIDFLRYHSYEKINNYLHSIVWKYPHLARVEEIGKSFENRNINLMKISVGKSAGRKARILITGGMNGNEWISSATALYAIQQLVENIVNSYMLEKADWYIIPLMNPDGYVYSRNHDHNWKNTRSCRTNCTSSNNVCLGVDLNKNFDFNCNPSDVLQDTSNYLGQYPFSESEAKALSDFLMRNYEMHLYLNINDYGQSISYPLGTYEKEGLKYDDESDLKYFAGETREAVYKYGGYKYAVRGLNSCGSEQWARKLGIKYVYNIKLGTTSQISESEVLPIAQEVFVAIRQLERIITTIYSVMYEF